ncbi:DUF3618 domain-containing protein [Sphingomonas prati]|uniref:DUF3618 domain-containing protein n=1 Tax=Sphingomonas prati TaxID=1843237 RepID=A0A7W9BSX9_9SPHN|nr:DUF3618 domain-containing protein [Sphingomonas prati]MBB5729431.1 hypothetical protein [Sphingomonas prati]GGE77465.1 hypothetical protein GCM10011404_07730 [Sphingomonas prati]
MSGSPEVLAAKARAAAARTRLDGTVAELKGRLQPSTLVHNAWADTVDRGADAWDVTVERGTKSLTLAVDKATEAGEAAVAYAQKRPGVVATGFGTALALLVGPSLVRRALRRPPPKPIPTDPPRLTGPIPHLETHS